MTLYVDEVLIIKIQEAVNEIGAELRLANNFTFEISRRKNDNDEKRLEFYLI